MIVKPQRSTFSLKTIIGIWFSSLLLSAVVGIITQQNIQFSVVSSELALILPTILFLRTRGIDLASTGFRREGWVTNLMIGLAIAPVSYIITFMVSGGIAALWPPPPYYTDALRVLIPKSILELTIWFLVVVFAIGPCEELLSRGFIQLGIEAKYGRLKGLIIASALFGLLHLDPWRSPGSAVAGLLIGYVYQKRHYNLWAPIGVHVGHDWIAFTISYIFPF